MGELSEIKGFFSGTAGLDLAENRASLSAGGMGGLSGMTIGAGGIDGESAPPRCCLALDNSVIHEGCDVCGEGLETSGRARALSSQVALVGLHLFGELAVGEPSAALKLGVVAPSRMEAIDFDLECSDPEDLGIRSATSVDFPKVELLALLWLDPGRSASRRDRLDEFVIE